MVLMSKMVDAINQTNGIDYRYGTSPELLCELDLYLLSLAVILP